MDKARERNDEGHREVVHILQSPGTKLYLQLQKFTQRVFARFVKVIHVVKNRAKDPDVLKFTACRSISF